MIGSGDITKITVDGRTRSAIRIGHKEDSLPSHILQGGKKEGVIVENGIPRPFLWDSITFDNDQRYVYFDEMELCSLEELFYSKRPLALDIVRNIAIGLENSPESFLNLETGVFPLYRIFLLEGSGVLLLPPDIGDVISILRNDEERMGEVNVLIRRDSEQQFKLIMEMAELLYYAVAGRLPYQDQDIRHYKYEEYPLENILNANNEKLDERTAGLINFILHAKRREMRDIMGNRSGGKALVWFLEKSRGLGWDLGEGNDGMIHAYEDTEEYVRFAKRSVEGAKRHNFFRRRGTVITVCAIAGVLLAAFLYDYISAFLEPPATAGMEQEDVVEYFYDAQSNIDPTGLMDAVKGASIPQENEVTNLYVTARMRQAYENIDPVLNVNTWIGNGMPAVHEYTMIYGVVLDRMERIDDDTLRAYTTWYTPYAADAADEDDEEQTRENTVYVYSVVQDFTFDWNDRGWWNIVDAPISESSLVDTVSVPVESAT